MRARLRRLVERGLVRAGAAQAAAWRGRHGAIVLAYHNVVPDPRWAAGDASLHLGVDEFRAQLDWLAEAFEVLPLVRTLRYTAGGTVVDRGSGRPKVAITFDDAYVGALVLGLEEVRNRGLPATVFVCPGRAGGEGFWWDRLAGQEREGLDGATRAQALGDLRGENESILAWAASEGRPLRVMSEWARSASEHELLQWSGVDEIEIGSHTMSHPNLVRASDSRIERELRASRSWLEERFPNFVPVLSYPYGFSDERVRRAARDAGYAFGLEVGGGWIRKPVDPFRVPRLNVPAGISLEGFKLRVTGVLGR